MIKTSMQLKAKIRNAAQGNSNKAQMLLRNFIMERFLERLSLSQYRSNIILKGGMLVASIAGLDTRATMDIDTTIKGINLSEEDVKKMINEIIHIDVDDEIDYNITSVTTIMDDAEYPGVRVGVEAKIDGVTQTIQLDFSTDEVITPSAIEYQYHLMFEDRTINIMAYNIETLLAEKLQTVLARGIANTRLRDFYDIFILTSEKIEEIINYGLLKEAFTATCNKRKYVYDSDRIVKSIERIRINETMRNLWQTYCKKNYYVAESVLWEDVIDNLAIIFSKIGFYE